MVCRWEAILYCLNQHVIRLISTTSHSNEIRWQNSHIITIVIYGSKGHRTNTTLNVHNLQHILLWRVINVNIKVSLHTSSWVTRNGIRATMPLPWSVLYPKPMPQTVLSQLELPGICNLAEIPTPKNTNQWGVVSCDNQIWGTIYKHTAVFKSTRNSMGAYLVSGRCASSTACKPARQVVRLTSKVAIPSPTSATTCGLDFSKSLIQLLIPIEFGATT